MNYASRFEAGVAALILCGTAVSGEIGKESRTGPMVFDLRLRSYHSTDQCPTSPAQENGVWEPGETIELWIEMGVDGGAGFTNVVGTLSTDNPGVLFLADTAAWPDIASGQSAFNLEPFRILLTADAPCFEDAGLSLAIGTDQGAVDPVIVPNVVGAGFEVELPLLIPDITDGTELPMQVTDDVIIDDLDVHLVVQHTWVGDLGFTLRSPSGTEVLLLDRPGVPASPFGCSNDDFDIVFDDSSSFELEDWCPGNTPWYVGDAAPVGQLSDFNGESTRGTWTLIATDGGGGDLGDLHNFELLATPPIQGPCEACGDAGVPAHEIRDAVLLALGLLLASTAILLRRHS